MRRGLLNAFDGTSGHAVGTIETGAANGSGRSSRETARMIADNGEKRLLNAVEALAASSEPIHRRLHTAGTLLLPLQASDFVEPADGELLEEILRALTGVSDPSGEHGDMVLSAFSMHDDQAVRVAQMICDLLRRIVSSQRASGQP